jgi:hypothetical protein
MEVMLGVISFHRCFLCSDIFHSRFAPLVGIEESLDEAKIVLRILDPLTSNEIREFEGFTS